MNFSWKAHSAGVCSSGLIIGFCPEASDIRIKPMAIALEESTWHLPWFGLNRFISTLMADKDIGNKDHDRYHDK